eukprot:gnl/TRDRNA2_/TRDRNA2_197652_c0_seq1.p1 gnl/TRDRNA2_/TRDRNA2_197652_c0~~gnl/TRDRNA2_/TRDRNA2_197652_c0_seq1.p1  ORF type:complete len:158 (-),score=16.70 gnl/TRDRNA2_/TRDRNA2_197652_c0_seq1:91-564(-)
MGFFWKVRFVMFVWIAPFIIRDLIVVPDLKLQLIPLVGAITQAILNCPGSYCDGPKRWLNHWIWFTAYGPVSVSIGCYIWFLRAGHYGDIHDMQDGWIFIWLIQLVVWLLSTILWTLYMLVTCQVLNKSMWNNMLTAPGAPGPFAPPVWDSQKDKWV